MKQNKPDNSVKTKLTKRQLILCGIAFLVMVIVGIVCALVKTARPDLQMGLLMFSTVMYLFIFVCAYSPSTWKMTPAQRMRYPSEEAGQASYRRVLVTMCVGIAVFMSFMMIVV